MRRPSRWLSLAALLVCPSAFAQGGVPGAAPTPTPVAAEAPTPSKPGAPQTVVAGIYINQIHEISLKENYFVADFYLWFRWEDDALKPYETFSVIDARIESQGQPVVKKLPDGKNHAYLRVVTRQTKFWDTTEYPLDNHQLAIIVEEDVSEDHLIRYVADTENSGADPRISMPGWHLAKTETVADLGVYKSNFGDVSLPTGRVAQYGRLTVALSFDRAGTTYFGKLFFGLWVSAAIAFLAFFIKPTDVDPRFGLGVGAIFAAIASEYIVTSSLPDTNIITLADKLHVVAFAFIFASIALSTWSLWLFQNEREAQSKRLDKMARWMFPVIYAALNALTIVTR